MSFNPREKPALQTRDRDLITSFLGIPFSSHAPSPPPEAHGTIVVMEACIVDNMFVSSSQLVAVVVAENCTCQTLLRSLRFCSPLQVEVALIVIGRDSGP